MTVSIELPDIGPAKTVADQAAKMARDVCTFALAQTIDSAERAQWAVDAAKTIKDRLTQIEAERDSIAKPLRKLANDVSARWKPAIDMLGRAVAHLRQAAVDWQVAERERQAAALPEATTHAEVARASEAITTKVVGLQERDTWSAEVVDERLLPREYWLIDQARLDREAREKKQGFDVPGARAVCRKTGALK